MEGKNQFRALPGLELLLLPGLELSGASSVSMFGGFMTSGNTGAVVYGLTYIKKDIISRVPDIYELETEATIPLALHRPKRGLLLPETSACRCLTENQGIPWKQSCPILKRKRFAK